jgi:hypothetical protein
MRILSRHYRQFLRSCPGTKLSSALDSQTQTFKLAKKFDQHTQHVHLFLFHPLNTLSSFRNFPIPLLTIPHSYAAN